MDRPLTGPTLLIHYSSVAAVVGHRGEADRVAVAETQGQDGDGAWRRPAGTLPRCLSPRLDDGRPGDGDAHQGEIEATLLIITHIMFYKEHRHIQTMPVPYKKSALSLFKTFICLYQEMQNGTCCPL